MHVSKHSSANKCMDNIRRNAFSGDRFGRKHFSTVYDWLV